MENINKLQEYKDKYLNKPLSHKGMKNSIAKVTDIYEDSKNNETVIKFMVSDDFGTLCKEIHEIEGEYNFIR